LRDRSLADPIAGRGAVADTTHFLATERAVTVGGYRPSIA
jgi:hypothetical protein